MTNKLSLIRQRLELLWQEVEKLEREDPGPGPGGTSDYTELTNKPSINGVELNGNKTLAQLGIASAATTYTKTEVDGEIIGAITDLDVSQTATTGHYIDYIAQEDGLIVPHSKLSSTVPTTDDNTLITSGAVAAALANKADKSTTYTKDEVDASQAVQNTEIGTLVNRGAKNLIPDKAFKSSTGNNVSCTVNTDGTATIKALSSAGASSTAFFTIGSVALAPGTYVLSGGVSNDVWVYVPDGSGNWTSTGNAVEKTFATATTATAYIRVAQGFNNTTGVIVKPMICTKADWSMSNEYEPYASTNRQLYTNQTGYTIDSDNGSFSSLIHNAATYCGVDDSKEVNGFVVFTSSVTSENLIGFFNFRYTRNVVFSPIISNTLTYSNQSQYGTIVITGGTGPYKAVVKFI